MTGTRWTCVGPAQSFLPYRRLELVKVPDLARYRSLILRLRFTHMTVVGAESVDALKGLTGLKKLFLYHCDDLQNVDVLKGLTGLEELEQVH